MLMPEATVEQCQGGSVRTSGFVFRQLGEHLPKLN